MSLLNIRNLSPKLIISLALITASFIIIFSLSLSTNNLNTSSFLIKKTPVPTVTAVPTLTPTITPNPTPTPVSLEELERLTKDWTTFTDPVLGFSFRYPDTRYRVSEDSISLFGERYGFGNNLDKDFLKRNGYNPPTLVRALTIFTKKKYQSRYGEYTAEPFKVWVFENLKNLSIDQWYEKFGFFPFGSVPSDYYLEKDRPRGTFKVDSHIGKYSVITGGPFTPISVFIRAEYMYLITAVYEDAVGTGNDSVIANLILSTFKFPNK